MEHKGTKTQRSLSIIVMAMAVLSLVVAACSVADGDVYDESDLSYATPIRPAAYEGEWTVNRQVVDTARLVVGETLRLRLPETYLLGLCAQAVSGADGHAADIEPTGVAAEISLYSQGYSEQAQYMMFASETYRNGSTDMRYIACSFYATIGGAPYRIDLVTAEGANAVMESDASQWTLGIPLTDLLLTDLTTGESVMKHLPATTHLYYATKRRTA